VNILIVDDEDGNRIALKMVVSAQGHQVREAINGAEAFEHVITLHQPVDLVITDNVMPIMSGLELVEKLRAAKYSGQIMAVSANLKAADEIRLKSLGVRWIFAKPFNLPLLRAALVECSQLQQAAAEAGTV
jgi:CheY-like chemotaxis protein